eukprot:5916130-Amphidinium_carterae.3
MLACDEVWVLWGTVTHVTDVVIDLGVQELNHSEDRSWRTGSRVDSNEQCVGLSGLWTDFTSRYVLAYPRLQWWFYRQDCTKVPIDNLLMQTTQEMSQERARIVFANFLANKQQVKLVKQEISARKC